MDERHLQKIACVGSGVIGTSWALCFAMGRHPVTVYDIGQSQLNAARASMEQNLSFLLDHQILSPEEADSVKNRMRYTVDLAEAVKDAQFVQESGPESYEIKAQILRQIEAAASAETVIASSTSGLLITEMSKEMRIPQRLVGGHPYNPPHLIPLVEIVKGEQTSFESARCAYDLYAKLGKEPVILNKEVTGFISNRLQVALYREAIDLVVNGVCSVEDIDKACLYGPGLRWGIMGPNLIFHLGGGNAGLGVMLERQRVSVNLRLSDMADWKAMPQAFIDVADAEIQRELNNRPREKGRTMQELVQYRDEMLLALLRLHKKL